MTSLSVHCSSSFLSLENKNKIFIVDDSWSSARLRTKSVWTFIWKWCHETEDWHNWVVCLNRKSNDDDDDDASCGQTELLFRAPDPLSPGQHWHLLVKYLLYFPLLQIQFLCWFPFICFNSLEMRTFFSKHLQQDTQTSFQLQSQPYCVFLPHKENRNTCSISKP